MTSDINASEVNGVLPVPPPAPPAMPVRSQQQGIPAVLPVMQTNIPVLVTVLAQHVYVESFLMQAMPPVHHVQQVK